MERETVNIPMDKLSRVLGWILVVCGAIGTIGIAIGSIRTVFYIWLAGWASAFGVIFLTQRHLWKRQNRIE